MSTDPEQLHFARAAAPVTGHHHRIVPQPFAVCRFHAIPAHYRGKTMDIRQIATELGCAMLEGSHACQRLARSGNSPLIDAETGGHIWAER